ncbi:uncharacterized protein LOC106170580 [Lingula anatina]|uniref:Uncharacterized protein LOC106170580 n=1 Tax=Lingula anatina TaxID=7574 RepID=A0A1S3J6C2_LINAN|nr:uncharacterized protein LOC106170580 [Lingula anatina]|eukprot:XP_013405940.1 uncharacterized protein LOC106170580 [Lingula anatina]
MDVTEDLKRHNHGNEDLTLPQPSGASVIEKEVTKVNDSEIKERQTPDPTDTTELTETTDKVRKKKRVKKERKKKSDDGSVVDEETEEETKKKKKVKVKKEKRSKSSDRDVSLRPDPEGGNARPPCNMDEYDAVIYSNKPIFSDVEEVESDVISREELPKQRSMRNPSFSFAQMLNSNTMLKFAIIGTEIQNILRVSLRTVIVSLC